VGDPYSPSNLEFFVGIKFDSRRAQQPDCIGQGGRLVGHDDALHTGRDLVTVEGREDEARIHARAGGPALERRFGGQTLQRLRIASPFVLRSVEPAPGSFEGHRLTAARHFT
jgi:hypothetical protein